MFKRNTWCSREVFFNAPESLPANSRHNRRFAKNNELGNYIRWGKGERLDEIGNKCAKALDAVTESLIGAIFPDAQRSGGNGMKTVQKFLEEKDFFSIIIQSKIFIS
jgi:dsRNA-specific ribonuclease